MRAIDPDLKIHLQSGATTLANCWRITRRDGVVLGFTDHDRSLLFDATSFIPDSGAIGSAVSSSADLAVDSSDIEGALDADALTSVDLAAGRYDGAGVEVFRVNWADTEQRVLMKTGVIGEVSQAGGAFRAELRGLSHHLGETVGRIYQRLCDVNLGSPACGIDLDLAQYKTTGAITALRDEQSFIASGFSGFVDGWFALGALTWTAAPMPGSPPISKARPQPAPSRFGCPQAPTWRLATGLSRGRAVTSATQHAVINFPMRSIFAGNRLCPAMTSRFPIPCAVRKTMEGN
ncbi:MAG: DUF2163 domain-containing protein [Marinicaulis sp.]|nr:DUF2163 domain-containing protein [Marinicaulis sp.]